MKKQLICLVATAILVQPFIFNVQAHAQSDKSLEIQIEELENEGIEKVKEYEDNFNLKQTEILTLDKEIIKIEEDIELITKNLIEEQYELEETENELAQKEEALAVRWESFKERLALMQKNGTPKDMLLEVILGSEDFSDLISRSVSYKQIVDADNEYLIQLQEATDKLEAEKEHLSNQLRKLEEEKKDLETTESLLEEKKDQLNHELEQLKEDELLRVKEEIKKQEELKKALIERQLKEKELLEKEKAEVALKELRDLSKYDLSAEAGVAFLNPAQGRLSSPFGYRNDPFTKAKKFHKGIDIANATGTPILATADGVVEKVVTSNDGYGKYVVVKHSVNGNVFYSLYAHLSMYGVQKGEEVKQGETIALMGSTGRSTGSHLHFELQDSNRKPFNPKSVLDVKEEKPKADKVEVEKEEQKEQDDFDNQTEDEK